MVKAFALTGRGDSTMRKTQGVASLALGYGLHWAFSPHLLNPKLELHYKFAPTNIRKTPHTPFISLSFFQSFF